jgi:hypothetical protein
MQEYVTQEYQFAAFAVHCAGLVALLWGAIFRLALDEGRFTLRALLTLIWMEALLCWLLAGLRTGLPF